MSIATVSSVCRLIWPLLLSENYKPVFAVFSEVWVTLLKSVPLWASTIVMLLNIAAILDVIEDLFRGGSGASGCSMLYKSSGIIGTARGKN